MKASKLWFITLLTAFLSLYTAQLFIYIDAITLVRSRDASLFTIRERDQCTEGATCFWWLVLRSITSIFKCSLLKRLPQSLQPLLRKSCVKNTVGGKRPNISTSLPLTWPFEILVFLWSYRHRPILLHYLPLRVNAISFCLQEGFREKCNIFKCFSFLTFLVRIVYLCARTWRKREIENCISLPSLDTIIYIKP